MIVLPYERVVYLLHAQLLDLTNENQLSGEECMNLAKALADVLKNDNATKED